MKHTWFRVNISGSGYLREFFHSEILKTKIIVIITENSRTHSVMNCIQFVKQLTYRKCSEVDRQHFANNRMCVGFNPAPSPYRMVRAPAEHEDEDACRPASAQLVFS